MKKKLLFIMLLLSVLLVNAIIYTAQIPTDASHINGNSSTFFGITADENLTTGFVFFNGSSIGAANCSGLNCNGTYNLLGFPDGNYTWYFQLGGFADSDTFNITIDRVAPSPISFLNVTAKPASDGVIQLNWSDYNESDFATYNVYIDTANITNVTGRVANLSLLQNNTEVSAGLVTGNNYFFAVTAVDKAGNENETIIISLNETAIDTIAPGNITGLNATSTTNNSITLDWTSPGDSDIQGFIIYVSNNSGSNFTELDNATGIQYNHTGLVTGDQRFYIIQAFDEVPNFGFNSSEVNATVLDTEPVADPVIDPITGTIINVTNQIINITYPENVTLKILNTNGDVIQNFVTEGTEFLYNFTVTTNGTFFYVLNGTKVTNNIITQTNYDITVDTGGNLSINGSIIENTYINAIETLDKGVALANGADHWIFKYAISMFGGDFVRFRMTNFTSGGSVIAPQFNSNIIFFCGEDYDTNAQNIISNPSKNVYNVTGNSYDLTQPALNCTDTNTSSSVSYDTYLKVPIPSGLPSGQYSWTKSIGFYNTII